MAPAEKNTAPRAEDKGQDKAFRVDVGHISEIGPANINGRVGDVENAQDTVNHGEADGDERIKASDNDAVDQLLKHEP